MCASKFAMTCIALVTWTGCTSTGGPSDTGVSPGDGNGDAYSVAPSTLTFQARGGDPRPGSQELQVTANALPLYLQLETSGVAIESASVSTIDASTARIVVVPAGTASVPVGTSTGSVRVIGCKDPVCSGQVAGSPKVIPVTYTKSVGGLTGTPGTLSFSQPYGAAPPADQSVTLRDLGDASRAWTSTVTYLSGADWLSVEPASGLMLPATVTVGVVPPAAAGTYQATIQFAVGTTSLFSVAVTYGVSADFEVTPATINVVGKQGQATADQTVFLMDALGGNYPWTAAVEYVDGTGWATLSPASGTSLPANVMLSLGALPDVSTHSAVLRIKGAGIERFVQIYYRQAP